jgi:hypothetical protein
MQGLNHGAHRAVWKAMRCLKDGESGLGEDENQKQGRESRGRSDSEAPSISLQCLGDCL